MYYKLFGISSVMKETTPTETITTSDEYEGRGKDIKQTSEKFLLHQT